jgi:hypothetical protein
VAAHGSRQQEAGHTAKALSCLTEEADVVLLWAPLYRSPVSSWHDGFERQDSVWKV